MQGRPRASPNMSPAEQRRHHAAQVRMETMLSDELSAAGALVDLIDSGKLTRDGPAIKVPVIKALFNDVSDRAMPTHALTSVFARVGIIPTPGHSLVQRWEVIDAGEELAEMATRLREELREVRRNLGKA